MSLPAVIARIESEIEFAGDAKVTEAEWRLIRQQLTASNTATLIELIRSLVSEVKFYTYLKSNRDLIAEANRILKEYE